MINRTMCSAQRMKFFLMQFGYRHYINVGSVSFGKRPSGWIPKKLRIRRGLVSYCFSVISGQWIYLFSATLTFRFVKVLQVATICCRVTNFLIFRTYREFQLFLTLCLTLIRSSVIITAQRQIDLLVLRLWEPGWLHRFVIGNKDSKILEMDMMTRGDFFLLTGPTCAATQDSQHPN